MFKSATTVLPLLFLIIYQIPNSLIDCVKTWTYDLTDINFKTNNPEFVDAKLEIVRKSRGVFAISGYIDVKQPLDETFSMEVIFYRDTYCQDNYKKQLYSVSNTSFPNAMNKFYKQLVMDSLSQCSTDTPVFETFQPPLEPCRMVFDKCEISTDNMPSHVDAGCYYASINIYGQAEVTIEVYAVIISKSAF